jgi:hypothetical protein
MDEVGAPGRVELPTNGLGNRCSIHLSYGASAELTHYLMWNREGREKNAVKAPLALGFGCGAQQPWRAKVTSVVTLFGRSEPIPYERHWLFG